jgi:hypothetical protein
LAFSFSCLLSGRGRLGLLHNTARDGLQVLVLAYLQLLELEGKPQALFTVALVLEASGSGVAVRRGATPFEGMEAEVAAGFRSGLEKEAKE